MNEPEVSIIIVTYNSKNYLKNCIESIYKQKAFSFEVLVVDNCSTDTTVEYLQNEFPDVKVIKSEENKGYGAGNNLGVKHAKGKYVVILNPDTVVEDNWLHEIIKPLEEEEKLITIPKVLLYDGSKINTCGLDIHFTGLAFLIGYGKKPSEYKNVMEVNGITGSCFAITKKHYQELGGFDEHVFMYHDDIDFSINAQLSGFKIMFIPTAIIRHDYELRVDSNKIYNLEKGRYLILKKYYNPLTMLIISPSLAISEILTLGYALKFGLRGVLKKYKSFYDVYQIKNFAFKRFNRVNFLNKKLSKDNQLQSKIISTFIALANIVFVINGYLCRGLK